jgi:hypothetical protein
MRIILAISLLSALGCGREVRIEKDPLPAAPLPVGGPGEEDDTDTPGNDVDPGPARLEMSVRFLEPGQHVVLNTQAGNTTGDLYLVTVPGEEVVPTPFVLEDVAVEGALAASAALSVEPERHQITVRASAYASVDDVAYAVGQAGPLPIEVCAMVPAGALMAQLTLTCEASMKVVGFGITAISASHDGQAWCNGVNLNGDTSLIPFTSPTTAVQNIPVGENGKACWPLSVYIGANSDDDGAGVAEAAGVFTFTATLP